MMDPPFASSGARAWQSQNVENTLVWKVRSIWSAGNSASSPWVIW